MKIGWRAVIGLPSWRTSEPLTLRLLINHYCLKRVRSILRIILLPFIQRNPNAKSRAAAGRTRHLNGNMMRVCYPMCDRESQSGATHIPRAGLIGAIEALKNVRKIFGRDADPGVGDFANRDTIHLLQGDGHLSTGWRVLDGIVDQNQEESAQCLRIARYRKTIFGNGSFERDLLG